MTLTLRPDIDPAVRDALNAITTPRVACGPAYSPQTPHPKQAAFLCCDDREVMYGGAAGGAKSSALLMAALQYVCVPGYAALLLRQTHPQLTGEDGLIPRMQSWLAPYTADGTIRWNQQRKRFVFPSSATVTFGHLLLDKQKLNYQSLAYQFVGFDEGTHWPTDGPYTYVGFSRVRRPARADGLPACPTCGMTLADVPLRTRMATNPGGPGHSWVRQRFLINGRRKGRIFIRSDISDNPSLDRETYAAGLSELPVVERERLLRGDWEITEEGKMFQRSMFVGVGN